MMKNFSLLLSIAGIALWNGANAFVPRASVGFGPNFRAAKESSTAVNVIDTAMIEDMEGARAAFVLCFAGAIGTAAIGREVIPVTIREVKNLYALKGKGTSSKSGGELDLFGYPEPVYADDVMAIINNNMTVYEMVEAYPISNQLEGYLRFESMAKANADTAQVAVRAVFDAIAIGVNKNTVAPALAAEKLELFRTEGLKPLEQNSRLNKTIGVVALVTLLTILGAADYFALFHLFHGWFPEWRGTEGLPFSLLDFPAYLELPGNFVNDIPAKPVDTGAFPMA